MVIVKRLLNDYLASCESIINLPCWFKASAFRPKGAPRNKRSEVALSCADWGDDADPLPIFGFIPEGCFLIAQKSG
jgi:hypothetical protein